jgi:superfamily I DNA/RNA helicase/RecB family exonuclease
VCAVTTTPELDADQRLVLGLPDGASAVVLGAPGSGRTTTAVALVADRIASGRLAPEQVLLLAPGRRQATRLRDRLLLAVGRPVNAPLARTAASLAFDIARRDAAADGRDAPVLLSGGEQDLLLAQLLPDSETVWPDRIGEEVRGTRAFRGELRELFARCTERDLDWVGLAELGERHGRPEWVATSSLWREYLEVLPAVHPDAFDSAELVALATAAVVQGRPGELAGALRLVVVDDMQDLGESAVGLLAALAARGCAIVAFGDPDIAADTFRGGEPDLLGRFEQRFGIEAPARLLLRTVHRHPASIRGFVAQVTQKVGTALAGTQRAAEAATAGGEPVRKVEADGPGALAARIAHLLRDRHLEADVPFGAQAVVVRSGALVEPLARALEIAGVPATTLRAAADGTEHASRSLLEVVGVGIGLIPLTPDTATALVTGPFCGLDRLALRRLRLALRVEELGGGGSRGAGELLVEALEAPGRLATIDAPYARSTARLAAVLQKVRELDAGGASAEELLWHVWEASGLAPVWRERALGAGLVAAEANRDLDDLVALFAAAARAAERGPTDPAAGFVTARLDADVVDDSLAPRGRREGVLVATPGGVAGLEFDTVVIAGLQDGVWPNLRPRGSLLGLGDLVAVLDERAVPAGAVDERRAVLSDELRLFALAASRARSVLLLAAVANDDEAPSVLFGLTPDVAPDTAASAPNALRPLVGMLRRRAVVGDADEQAEAASALARLARAEVPGASPAAWWGLAATTTDEPLVPDPSDPVRVSPSKLEAFERSPLDWFVDRVAGGEPLLAGAIGTMLHWVLETATAPDEPALLAALEGRWRELDFEAEWVEAREHRLAQRMIGAISRYLADRAKDGSVLLGGETPFEFAVGRALATGTIDRVERGADGRVRVVDLKTGSTRPSTAETRTHAQLGIYQLAVRAGVVPGVGTDAPSDGAALLFVRQKGKEPYALLAQPSLDEESAEAFRERLATAAEGMAGGSFEGPVEPEVRFGSSTYRPMLLRVPEVCGG